MEYVNWGVEILLKLIFFYAGILAIKGEINIGALGQFRIMRWAFGILLWSVIVTDTYHNYIAGKYF